MLITLGNNLSLTITKYPEKAKYCGVTIMKSTVLIVNKKTDVQEELTSQDLNCQMMKEVSFETYLIRNGRLKFQSVIYLLRTGCISNVISIHYRQ